MLERWGVDRLDLLLFAAFVIVAGSWVSEVTAQPSARYLLTAAIVEQHTVVLDDYEPALGVDRIETDDHVYSDKAPLQPLLGVPILAVAEMMGVPKASTFAEAPSIEAWAEGNIGSWTQTFVFAVLPGAALLPLLRRHARRFVDDRAATISAIAIVSSTMILLFSVYLYAHVFVAFLTFLAWHILSSSRWTPAWRITVAGALVALAFAAEYPVIGAGCILGLWVWHRHGFLRAVGFGVPTVLAGVGVLGWNRAVYGTLGTSYDQKEGDTLGFLAPPKLYNTFEIFFGRKGFVFTPIVLLALVGLGVALWQRRPAVAVPAGIFMFVFLLQAGWGNPWGGETANPRYMLLALPFLAYPLAMVRHRVSPMFFRSLVALGVLSMGLAAITLELIPDGEPLIGTSLRYLREGQVGTTIFTEALGPAGWAVYAAMSLAILAAAARAVRALPSSLEPRPAPADELFMRRPSPVAGP